MVVPRFCLTLALEPVFFITRRAAEDTLGKPAQPMLFSLELPTHPSQLDLEWTDPVTDRAQPIRFSQRENDFTS